MQIARRSSREIKIGTVSIGANHPIAVQSMAKTRTSEVEKTLSQIKELGKSGCEIVRLAVKDSADARAIKKIKAQTKLPLVADIHFDWHLALTAIDSGADKIRLNPGNIDKLAQIREVVTAAKRAHIPIRVGVNSGSLKSRLQKPGKSQADAMVSSVLDYLRILEGFKFYDIVISLKASTVEETVAAYRKVAPLCDYPLHLGVTATGLPRDGLVKSSIACGILLSAGIGDTLRISLTAKPQEEVAAARAILQALGLRHFGPEIISCPTCGRCEVDLFGIVRELEKRLSAFSFQLSAKDLKVAVMGCVVNGPGEANQADLGVAFGKKKGLLFKDGKPLRKVSQKECVDVLVKNLYSYV